MLTGQKNCSYLKEYFFYCELLLESVSYYCLDLTDKPLKGNKYVDVSAFSLFLCFSLWVRWYSFLVNAASLLHLLYLFTI